MRGEDYFDEQTLTKVYAGLEAAGITGQDAIDAVNQMQNEGILFRERDPRSTLREAIVHALENTQVDALVTVQHGEELLSDILQRLKQVGFDPDSYPQAHTQGETA